MKFAQVLRLAMERSGWSATKVAYIAGSSESAVRKWLSGETEPRWSAVAALRREMPTFADLLDTSTVSAA